MTVSSYKIKLVREAELEFGSVSCASEATEILRSIGLDEECEEYFYLVCLDTRGSVVGLHEVSHGDLSTTIVNPREVFKRAIVNNAASIIVAHNHPSGDVTPSGADIELTKRLHEAGKLIGIKLLDHIIIGRVSHYSFAGEGRLG